MQISQDHVARKRFLLVDPPLVLSLLHVCVLIFIVIVLQEPRHCRLWEEMKETGVLNMELVEHVFSKFCQQGVVKEDILKMMMKFGLIVSFALSPTEEKYFVPCHLRSPSDILCKEEPSPEDPCPLYLDFQRMGYVPHGLYLQLVSRCTKWCSTSGFKEPPELYDGASLFFIGKELTHKMVLVCKKRFIKIVLRQIKQNDGSSCEPVSAKEVPIRVRTFLNEMMQNLPETLPWFKNVAYELCVKCPYCLEKKKRCVKHGQFPCHDERCFCLKTVKPDGSCTYCRKSHPVKILPLPELKRWFSSSSDDSSIQGGADMIKNDFLKFASLNYLNLCFVITQYHGRSLSIEVDSTISPNIAIIQL